MRQSRKAEAYIVSMFILLLIIVIFYIDSSNSSLFNISSTFYHKFTLNHHISHTHLYLNTLESIRIVLEDFFNLFKIYPLKVTLLEIRPRLVSIDLIYFHSSYSLEVRHSIQGESSFLDIYLNNAKIKLILYFLITLHIEAGDPVGSKY